MKGILSILLGLFIGGIISILNFFVFAFIIRFSLSSILTMLFIQIFLSIITILLIKKKYVRIGIILSSFIFISYIGFNLYKKLNFIEHKVEKIHTTNFEKSEQDKRDDLMKDTTLTLFEKFTRMKLGKLSDSIVIAFTIKNEFAKKNSKTFINSLNIDFTKYGLVKYTTQQLQKNAIQFYGDSIIKFVLENGKEIFKDLKPPIDSDSLVYVGYLPSQNLLIFAKGISEYGINYTSINLKTGQEIDGVPLFHSPNKPYYSFIHFYHFIGDIELIIDYWVKDKNEHFINIHKEKIPLNIFKENDSSLPFSISGIEWETSKFSFIISYHDTINNKKESIRVESKIIDLHDK